MQETTMTSLAPQLILQKKFQEGGGGGGGWVVRELKV